MLKPRAKTMGEYKDASSFIWSPRPLALEEKAAKNVQSDQHKQTMASVVELLGGYTGDWSAAALEPLLVKFCEDKGLKLGQLAQPLRAALTGSNASPGIYEVRGRWLFFFLGWGGFVGACAVRVVCVVVGNGV